MGRLSAYAKKRILKLRFKKNKRIIHIVEILKHDDNIKVSRQAVSTFLKKYLETNSIYDKPRTGRKRKLTAEEIQLIGQVTRLNRDITARAIKEYLNLNVSTYTILRATKLFEWNKTNPNSNDSKKQAASASKLNANKARSKLSKSKNKSDTSNSNNGGDLSASHATETDYDDEEDDNEDDDGEFDDVDSDSMSESGEVEKIQPKQLSRINSGLRLEDQINGEIKEIEEIEEGEVVQPEASTKPKQARVTVHSIPDFEKVDLNIIPNKELVTLKNLSCSPMSFATKLLFKLFKPSELHGHNVSGKTLNRNAKSKLPLDPIRVGYIKFLVEKSYADNEFREQLSGASSKLDLWRSCHTAINKAILISERKANLRRAAIENGEKVDGEGEGESAEVAEAKAAQSAAGGEEAENKENVYEFKDNDEENQSDSSSIYSDDDEDDDDESDFDISKYKNMPKVVAKKAPRNEKKDRKQPTKKRQRRFKSNESLTSTSAGSEFEQDAEADQSEYSGAGNGEANDDSDSDYQQKPCNGHRLAKKKNKKMTKSLGGRQSHGGGRKQHGTAENGNEELELIKLPRLQTAAAKRQRHEENSAASEALAAANIAASMKKRQIVVADVDQSNKSEQAPVAKAIAGAKKFPITNSGSKLNGTPKEESEMSDVSAAAIQVIKAIDRKVVLERAAKKQMLQRAAAKSVVHEGKRIPRNVQTRSSNRLNRSAV